MSSIDDDLWAAHTPTKEQYQQGGGWMERTGGSKPDCACGCKWYFPLAASRDFGVCTNPISCRRGQLTFEHWGCFDCEC